MDWGLAIAVEIRVKKVPNVKHPIVPLAFIDIYFSRNKQINISQEINIYGRSTISGTKQSQNISCSYLSRLSRCLCA
jgi:hypothetical protein